FYYARWAFGLALQFDGQLPEAIAQYKKAAELTNDPFVLAWLAQGYAQAGQRDEALKLLAQMDELATKRYVGAWSFAIVHLALGEKEKQSTSSSALFANAAIPSSLSSKSVRSLIPCAAIHVSRPCLQKLSLPEKNENSFDLCPLTRY